VIGVGDILDSKYRLVALIGEGAMGQVFRAVHITLHKQVAIKVLSLDLARTAENRLRFEREAKVCAQLKHPGVVSVHDVGSHDGCPYLVMDLLSGHSLNSVIDARGSLPDSECLEIAAQLADALIAAHEVRLVHRDLKPENIMMEEKRPIIVDFGLAFIDSALGSTGRLTEHGVVVGTPAYRRRGCQPKPSSQICIKQSMAAMVKRRFQ
jgi:serine/threonine protein kinase